MQEVARWLILGAIAMLLVAGCGGKSRASRARDQRIDRSAALFAVRVDADLRSGRFARAWRTLHPAQRRVVTAKRLAVCYPGDQYPRRVTFEASAVRSVGWTVPGTRRPAQAKAVTVNAKSRGQVVQTFTQHVVRNGRGWAWMLSGSYFRAARSGRC
jgi:hypothetical protein